MNAKMIAVFCFNKYNKGIVWLVIAMLRFYQIFISPLKPATCRFFPNCSQYAILAVEKYGIARGLFMAVRRILRCHPFHPGGYDPVR